MKNKIAGLTHWAFKWRYQNVTKADISKNEEILHGKIIEQAGQIVALKGQLSNERIKYQLLKSKYLCAEICRRIGGDFKISPN